MPGRGRPILVGVLLGLLVVVGLLAYAAYMVTLESPPGAPEEMLVVVLTEDVDGAQVAGIVGVLDWTPGAEGLRVVDPLAVVEGTGTSYTALKDQYPFGGGDAVSEAVASVEGGEALPWVVLPADAWIDIVDDTGGVALVVDSPTNAYLRGELFLIDAGEQTLSGGESYAIAASAFSIDETQGAGIGMTAVSEAVLETLDEAWLSVVDAVEAGEAESSLPAATLQETAR